MIIKNDNGYHNRYPTTINAGHRSCPSRPGKEPVAMYVCLCKGLTEADIQRAAQSGMPDSDSLTRTLGLEDEDCCGRCIRDIHQLMSIASNCCASP
jgi:bacterioferritin-associated ferredoxin